MASLSINPFDAAVYICLFVAVVMGCMTGMLRSLATIFGYAAAMGLAVALAPQLAPLIAVQFKLSPAQTGSRSAAFSSWPACCSARCCGFWSAK